MINESVKKSLQKSKNVLEEKRKIVKPKICIKKKHVYNNCYELRSRAIKNCKKNKKNGLKFLNFSVNFPEKKMLYTKKTLTHWYLNIPSVTSFYSNPT